MVTGVARKDIIFKGRSRTLDLEEIINVPIEPIEDTQKDYDNSVDEPCQLLNKNASILEEINSQFITTPPPSSPTEKDKEEPYFAGGRHVNGLE